MTPVDWAIKPIVYLLMSDTASDLVWQNLSFRLWKFTILSIEYKMYQSNIKLNRGHLLCVLDIQNNKIRKRKSFCQKSNGM